MDAKIIREKREELGLTQSELAALIGVSLRTIQNYEKDGVIPSSKYEILRNVLNTGNINITGDGNIANTGIIQGDCIIDSTIIHLSEPSLLDLLKTFSMDNSEKEQSLVNLTDAQKKLADAIDKFAQAELIRAEADKLRAKADENNSEANLNYSKIMLEDRALIKQMIDKLK